MNSAYSANKCLFFTRALTVSALLASLTAYGCGDDSGADGSTGGGVLVPDGGNLGDGAVGDGAGVGTDTATAGDDTAAGGDTISGTTDIGTSSGGTSSGGGDDGGASSGGGDDGGASSGGGDDGGSSSGGDDGGGSTTDPYPHACNPCKATSECADDKFPGAACADHGAAIGAFCAAKCGDADACADGYTCKELEDVDGNKAKFCVLKDDKECSCSDAAIKAGATTTCSVSADVGGATATCKGVRTCGKDGLSACDAAKPSAEVCDGDDNDCDGKVDDANDCDDKNPCTDDVCTGAGGCKSGNNTAKCDDNDACTADDACADGKCGGTAKNCDDSNACTADACDPKEGGCSNTAAAGACDDGDACTADDQCKDGACVAGEPSNCDDGNPCTKNSCAVDTGKCATQTEADGKGCDDANECTKDDACAVGLCTSATQVDCDDGNACTLDSCDAKAGCSSTNDDSANCDDGDLCTNSSSCSAGKCVGADQADCDDKNPCTTDSCDPADGSCAHKANTADCDDGNKCTEKTKCAAGKCEGTPVKCDDSSPCTDDQCDNELGCIYKNNTAKCDDGNKCSVEDVCKDGKCAGVVKDDACDDENPCTKDSCDPTNGCQHADHEGASCDDGDACTENDSCKAGKCVAGTDACQCTKDEDCKDDGNLCNGVPTCKDSKCQLKAGSVVKCDTSKDGACLKTSCDPAEGQCKSQAATDGTDCDDGANCTTESSCAKGVCTATANKDCDDSNPCTADSCNPDDGKCLNKALPDCVFCKEDKDCDNKDACFDKCVSNKCEFVDPKECASLPDLTAAAVAVTSPAGGTALIRNTITVSYTIANAGKGDAADFAYALVLSADDTLDKDDAVISSGTIAGLKAGAKSTKSEKFFLDGDKVKAGDYHVLLATNIKTPIKEITPANNTKSAKLAVKDAPDLNISKLSADKSAYKQGDKAVISFVENNVGTAAAPGHKIRFYLSKSATTVTKDSVVLLDANRDVLAAGKPASGSPAVTIPKSVANGTWYILAINDFDEKIVEGIETNNTNAFKVVIASDNPANLVATSVAIGKKLWAPGESITVSYTVENNGDKPAGAFKIGIYTHTTNKAFAGARWVKDIDVKGLAAKGKLSPSSSFTLPTWLGAKGTYYIWIFADRTGAVAEGNENDNQKAGAFGTSRSGTDLAFTDSALNNSVFKTTDTINIQATVRNNGQSPAGGYSDRIYFSTNKTLDGKDPVLATIKRSALNAGASQKASFNFKAPTGTTPGTYYIGYRVDYTDAVKEWSEANNLRWHTVTLIDPNAKGDLAVSGFNTVDAADKPLSSYKPGDTVLVAKGSTIANPTKVPVGKYSDVYVGSTNSTISTGDPIIKRVDRSGLAASAKYSAGTSFKLSTGLKKGDYWLALWTDRYSQVAESNENNNKASKKITITVNGVDLRPTAFTANKTTFEAGTTLSVSYGRENIGGIASGGFSDGFLLSTDQYFSASDKVLVSAVRPSLAAGAKINGTGSVKIPDDTKPGIYYLLYVNDHKTAVDEMSESNNYRAIQVNVQAKGDAPDLYATIGAIPAVAPGQSVSTAIKVWNLGKKDAGAFVVDIYTSTNSSITASDILVGSVSFSGLKAGASATANKVVKIPTGYFKTTYYIGTWVDRANKILEKNEGNNTWARSFSVTANGADLQALGVVPTRTLDATTKTYKYKAGEYVTATVTHRNNGGVSTGAGYSHALYLSTNTAFSTTEIVTTGSYSTALSAGGTRSVKLTFQIPTSTKPAVWYLGYRVDRTSVIHETSESNNIKWVKLTIDPPPALPDLDITTFKPPVTTYKPGDKVNMSVVIGNKGQAGAGKYRIGFYSSSDTIVGNGDKFLYGWEAPALAAGKTYTDATKFAYLPTNLKKGTWYIGGIVDYTKAVTEKSETNNTSYAKLTISVDGLDLQPTSVVPSATKVQAGKAVTLTINVKNNGGIAAFSHYNGYYLSTDSTITRTDSYLSQTLNTTHAAGATETFKPLLTIPANTKPGKYWIGVYTDRLLQRDETNENNNGLGVAIEVTPPPTSPDLTIPGLVIRSSSTATTNLTSAKPGQGVYAWTTEKNIGDGSAGARRTGYYVSSNSGISKADQYVENYYRSAALGAGKSELYKYYMVLPTNLKKGTYYIGAIANYNDALKEKSTTNNHSVGYKLTITVDGADYTPTAFTTTKSLYKPGESVSASFSRKNIGGVTAGSAYDGFYLSTNSTWDDKDTYLGRKLQSSQTAGSTRSSTHSFTLPKDVKPGNYYLIYKVNYQGVVKETSTVNNHRWRYISVTSATGTPNLHSTGLTVNDSTVTPGQLVTLTVKVENNGNGATGTYVDGFYGSTSSSLLSLSNLRGTRTGTSIAAGKANTYTKSLSIPTNLVKGSYYLAVFHDYENKIAETSESIYDNRRNVKVTVEKNGIDLNADAIQTQTSSSTSAPAVRIFKAGQTMYVKYTRKNLGEVAAPGRKDAVYLSNNTVLDDKDIKIKEWTGSSVAAGSTQTYTTSFKLPTTLKAGTYYVAYSLDVADTVKEYNEKNNVRWSLSFTVTDTNGEPDFDVTALSVSDTTVNPGQSINVTTSIKNIGNGASPSTWRVGYYASPNITITTGDQYIKNQLFTSALAAGGTRSHVEAVTIPTNLKKGTYYLGTYADDDLKVKELSESNNGLGIKLTINVDGRDLSPILFAATKQAFKPGDTVSYTGRIHNYGDISTTTIYDRVYLSKDTKLDDKDTIVYNTGSLGTLAANSGKNVSGSFKLPTVLAEGTWYLIYDTDRSDFNKEYNEDNNTRAYTIYVTSSAGVPDFDPSSVTTTTTTFVPGQSVTWTVKVQNVGTKTSPSRKDGFYIGTDGNAGDADDKYFSATTRSVAIGVNGTDTYTRSTTLPTNLVKGGHYLNLVADYDKKVAEVQEGNNQYNRYFYVSKNGLDFRPHSLAVGKTSLKQGETTSLSFKVKNYGEISSPSIYSRVYLSTDANITTSDVYLGKSLYGSSWSAGQERSYSTSTLRIPENTKAGTYYIGVIADYNNARSETSESNNTVSVKITVTAGYIDLVTTAVTTTASSYLPGGSISARVDYRNQGTLTAGAFRLGLYGSTNTVVSTGDHLISSYSRTSLSPSTSSTYRVFSGKLRYGIKKGNYYIGGYIDDQSKVTEKLGNTSYESNNNDKYKLISISKSGPDLYQEKLTCTTSNCTVKAGQNISFSYTRRNLGEMSTSVSNSTYKDGYYLSTNTGFSTSSDKLLREITRSALDAGKSIGGSSSATIPAGTAAGTYYLFYVIDHKNEIDEYSEGSNNYRYIKITVTK